MIKSICPDDGDNDYIAISDDLLWSTWYSADFLPSDIFQDNGIN